MNQIIKDYKKIDWVRTSMGNLGQIWLPLGFVAYLVLCFNALDKIVFSQAILEVPFIILIAMSAIKLVQGYNPSIALVMKMRRSAKVKRRSK